LIFWPVILSSVRARKTHQMGIKAFLVSSSSTGYVFRLKIYTGKQEGVTTSIQKLVEEMVHPFEEDGHILYAENDETSVELLKSLREKNIRCTGTIRRNRLRNTSILTRFKKDPKGTTRFFTNSPENNLTLCFRKTGKMSSSFLTTGITKLYLWKTRNLIFEKYQ